MRALVTGATGFLGRYLTAELLRRGHHVTAVLRPSTDTASLDPRLAVVRADLREEAAGVAAEAAQADALFHLLAGTRGSWRAMFDASVHATERLLSNLAESRWDGHLVHVSSVAVYDPRHAADLIDEDTPLDAEAGRRDDYAWTKVLQEQLVATFSQAGPATVTVVRPGFIYGSERGFQHPLGRRVGARLLLMKGGWDIIPLNYAENTASLLVACAEHSRAAGQAFHAVDPDPVTQCRYLRHWLRAEPTPPVVIPLPKSVLRAAGAIYGLTGYATGGRVAAPGFIGTERSVRYTTSKAEELLGWSPPVGPQEALRRTFEGGGAA